MGGVFVFLERFIRFLLLLPLLNLNKIRLLEMVFCFCGVWFEGWGGFMLEYVKNT